MRGTKMLTKDVISMVYKWEDTNNKIQELIEDNNHQLNTILKLLGDATNNVYVTGVYISENPYGKEHPDGTYVDEHCGGSLYSPDSGYGTQYIPIENGTWLALTYDW